MLINGNNGLSGGRLPSSLLETYVRYKKDTKVIVAWLVSHGTRRYKSLSVVSIRDLMRLASIVQEKAVVMPATIDFHFREAIAARTQLTKFFRQKCHEGENDQETVNHEFFTKSLDQIYSGLCECCARPDGSCRKEREESNSLGGSSESANRYAILHTGYHDTDCRLKDASSKIHCNLKTNPESGCNKKTRSSPEIIDDPLSDAFEIRKQVQVGFRCIIEMAHSTNSVIRQEMEDLLSVITSVWEQAAREQIPIVVASFMTNVVFAIFEGIDSRLRALCNDSEPNALGTEASQTNGGMGKCLDAPQLVLSDTLRSIWSLLSDFAALHKTDDEVSPIPKPSQATVRKGPCSASMDHECYKTLVGNIGQYMRTQRRPPCIVLNGSPLYADIGYLLTHEDHNSSGLRCSYGLQVLLETYKSYLLTPNCAHAPSSCRLRALQFAQEIEKSIDPVLADSSMPCRCCQTLAFHLEHFQLDLQAFIQERVFDLYFQNPWVSGSQSLEMLELSFYYGLRLFSYRHFVGSVLHVYNVLRNLMDFQEIPLLERLCDIFNDIVFPGGRPERNFRACCMRYMGGRVRFNNHAAGHKSGCHKFEIPIQSAKATAGFGLRKEANDSRFQYRKISLLHHVKEADYHLYDGLWERVAQLNANENDSSCGKKKQSPCHHHRSSSNGLFSTSSQHQVCQLQTAVLAEFSGPFPVAKINPFRVYLSCVQIVSMISDGAHEDKDQGARCLCFLEAMVTAADRYNNNRHKLQPFGCKELVRHCKEAMTTVLGNRLLEEFLWKGV